jgi:dTDP-4-amino-4,6-dideoxygalactose transaminase
MKIQMVDLQGQYKRLKKEMNASIQEVINSAAFINGQQVNTFCTRLAEYMQIPYVIPCGNGTDAIRLALQACNVQPGDEVILPAFSYIAPAEMVALMGLIPVLVDVRPETFNINTELLERAITRQTKAIIVVHLFGQSCDMEPVMKIAEKYKIIVIEDNAQSLGTNYTFSDGTTRKAGTIGHIGTTSFFPTKPLSCYGDGGAVMTSNSELAERIRMIANHGQTKKYHHKVVGCNSRLDTIQAAILNVKLNYMDDFTQARQQVARYYDQTLSAISGIRIPEKATYSTHVYHQYTLRVKNNLRDALQAHLKERGIPSTVYYPFAIHEQEGYKWVARVSGNVNESSLLCKEVLSLPIHTEMTDEMMFFITDSIGQFMRKST